ncbi:MAG: hypothetical protein IE909_16130, partial [Campylobacterales bacterium]|nr:hypothetical protein [Campylobacterales bacterium]
LLNPAFGEFITRDFEREINERIYDTIAVSKVLVGNKAVAGKTRKTFERDIAPFQMARTDSVFGKNVQIGKKFFIDNLEVNFGESGKVNEMRAHHPRGGNSKEISLVIDGIAIGDSEEKLLDRYTCSTVFRNWGASLKDPDDGYYYQVSFVNAKGFAFFHIWEKRVYAIEVTFFE